MKYIRGFLMAWGCFCWIPCPYKQWHEEDRVAMVAVLPLVGTGLGLVTALIWWLTGVFGAGDLLSGAVVTAAYFILTGFIHLDGFMDVCDAVMPRHPQRQERVRILKDPHTGSFAAVSMVLMLLIFAASMAALSGAWITGALAFIAVTATSRCVSAVSVICCAPMQTSQYHSEEFRKGRSAAQSAPAVVIALLTAGACAVIALKTGQSPGFATGDGLGLPPVALVPVAAVVCALTALIIGKLDRRSLGGMNGDISGHMITSGEMAGLLAAALLMG